LEEGVASSAERSISITSTLLTRLQREAGAGQAWVRVCVRRHAIGGTARWWRWSRWAWGWRLGAEMIPSLFFFTLPRKAQEKLMSAAILAMDDPITEGLASAGCYQVSYIEILSGKNTIELRVSIFKVYVHLKIISQMKH
jgi:hypothetical protein